MTSPTPHPAADRDLASPVDRQLADALRGAGRSLDALPEDVAAQHLAAITALAAEHVHTAPRPAATTWRSRMRRVAGLTVVKVAVGAGVATAATTGGLAAGGNLPDPVQGVVADGARWVGIELPRPTTPASTPDTSDDGHDRAPQAPAVQPEDLLEDVPEDRVVDPPVQDARPDVPADARDEVPAPGPRPGDPPAVPPPPANDEAGPPADVRMGEDGLGPHTHDREHDERPTPPAPAAPDADRRDREDGRRHAPTSSGRSGASGAR